MSDLEIETVRKLADGKSVRRNARYKYRKGPSYSKNIDDSFMTIDREFSRGMCSVTEVDLKFIPPELLGVHSSFIFPLVKKSKWDDVVDMLEELCVSKKSNYSKYYCCWYTDYVLPICGHYCNDTKSGGSIKKSTCVDWNGKKYDLTYLYQYVGRRYVKLCPKILPDVTFDSPEIVPLKFEMYDSTQNKNYSLLRCQKFTRELSTFRFDDVKDMASVIINCSGENYISHLEIVGDRLITFRESMKEHHGVLITDPTNVPYITKCKIFFRTTKDWIPLGIFTCNANSYTPVLIDLRYHSTSKFGIDCKQIKIVPTEWYKAPVFRVAVYGTPKVISIRDRTISDYVTYKVYFPRPESETIYYPVRCGKDCMCGGYNGDTRRKELTNKIINYEKKHDYSDSV